MTYNFSDNGPIRDLQAEIGGVVNLCDVMMLYSLTDNENIIFSVKAGDTVKKLYFFESNKNFLRFFQNGEELIYDHLKKDSVFYAFSKEKSKYSFSHQLYAFIPGELN